MKREMFHTQEKREKRLNKPLLCRHPYAWLGTGYYFWDSIRDAHAWGRKSKKGTGDYEIYKGSIESEDILDTIFNEEHYNFWVKQIEKVAVDFLEKTGSKPSLKEINDFFKEKSSWDNVSEILFQDLPKNDSILVKKFNYLKRIQLVIFKLAILKKFDFVEEYPCKKKGADHA